jgi:PAS domain S-box-containing protein
MTEARQRVLVVDDAAEARLLAREALEGVGYEVYEAADGAQAIEAFSACLPDLILLDVLMPVMDGFEACAAIRRLPGGQHVPVLVLTGLEDVDSINRAFDVGATDFVTKPINYLSLGFRVRYMLRAKQTADDLRESEARLARAQRMARLGHWELDAGTRLARWSPQICEIFGFPESWLEGPLDATLGVVHPEDRGRLTLALERALAGEASGGVQFRVVRSSGGERIVESLIEPVRDEGGRVLRITGTSQDVTERTVAERQIRQLAYFDQITGLPNRSFLREHLGYLVGQAERQRRTLAVLYVDLDRFKRVNDTLGHSTGDDLLRQVARRFLLVVRGGDCVVRESPPPGEGGLSEEPCDTVARVGGDEFIVLLGDLRQAEDAARVARRLLDALKQPVDLAGRELFVSASIGIAVFPDDGRDSEVLLQNADVAMYHAKELGRDSYQFYTESLNARAFERLALEGELRRAVERGDFELHYQPKLDLDTGTIGSAEALVRWCHPQLGLVPPRDFISLAEETGLILPLGQWVLTAAASQMRRWEEEGRPALRLAVNLSVRQFRDPGLAAVVRQALLHAGLDRPWLELEITESVLMGDPEASAVLLRELKRLGVRVSIDDFGTGYSSLSYLKRLPLDLLKIDRSFTRDILTDSDSQSITRAIIYMAHGLKLRVVAEGVESVEQLDFLRTNGCDEVQGYLLSVPLPGDEFAEQFLTDGATTRPVLAAVAGR